MASEATLGREGRLSRPASDVRPLIADASSALARIAFGLTIVLSPLRAALVVASRPQPPLFSGYTDLTLSIAEIALLATLALWAVSLAARPRPIALGPAFLRWPVAGLLALTWLSVPFSVDPALSAFNAAELLAMAGLGLYALNEVGSVEELTIPIAGMIAIESIVGLGQLLEQRSVGLQWLGELGLDPSQRGISVVAASGVTRLLRAYGLSEHPNILGGLLAIALPLVAVTGSWRGRAGVTRSLVLALGLAAVFATFSRTAWLALAAGLAVGFAMLLAVRGRERGRLPLAARTRRMRLEGLRADRRIWVAVAATIVLLLALAIPYGRYVGIRSGLFDAASVTETMSTGERAILADQALRLAAAHPLTGTGFAAMAVALHDARQPLTFDYQPAHIVLLDVAAELGILAALLYAVLLVGPWLALLRDRTRWTPELAASSAALAAVTIAGFFDYYTWTWTPGRIWAWLVLGLWAAAYARSRKRPVDAR